MPNLRDQLFFSVKAPTNPNQSLDKLLDIRACSRSTIAIESSRSVYSLLTQPDFSELPRSEFLHHLDRLFRNLPGAFIPRLLSFGSRARTVQFTTQAICFAWKVYAKTLRTKGFLLHCSVLVYTGWHGLLFR